MLFAQLINDAQQHFVVHHQCIIALVLFEVTMPMSVNAVHVDEEGFIVLLWPVGCFGELSPE